MAKERDHNPGGRMLFTDFDASEKGRPVAEILPRGVQEQPERIFFQPPVPSLRDLALSLGFDFEDDDGAEASAPSRHPVQPPVPDLAEDARSPASRAPSWEEFTDAFRHNGEIADRAGSWPPTGDETRRIPAPRPFYDDEASASAPESSEEDAPVDADFDPDFDILSALTPTPETASPRGEWRGGRLGLEPPRAIPYGGIERVDEWYRPPETVADAGGKQAQAAIDPVPVSAEADGRESPAKDTTNISLPPDTFSGIDLDALWQEKVSQSRRTRRFRGKESIRTGTSELFADLDLDAAWEERVQEARREGKDGVAGRTHSRLPRPDDPRHRRERGGDADGEGTVILDSPFADKAATVPADSPTPQTPSAEPVPSTPAAVDATLRARVEESPTTTVIDSESPFPDSEPPAYGGAEGAGAVGDAAGTAAPEIRRQKRTSAKKKLPTSLEDLDIEDLINTAEDDSGEFEAVAEEKAAGPEGGASSGMTADALLASLDLDADIPAVNNDVQAPVLDDTAIVRLDRRDKKRAGDSPETPAASVSADAVSPAAMTEAEAEDAKARGGRTGEKPDAGTPSPDAPEGEGRAKEEPEAPADEAAAVNPLDVFANMGDMDFSDDDGLDDEMRAMLDEGTEEKAGDAAPGASAAAGAAAIAAEPPKGWRGKLLFRVRGLAANTRLGGILSRIQGLLAWRENWWFYCDLVAAVIASASLAVIVSYYLWYR